MSLLKPIKVSAYQKKKKNKNFKFIFIGSLRDTIITLSLLSEASDAVSSNSSSVFFNL